MKFEHAEAAKAPGLPELFMIVIFTPQETAVERALQNGLKLLLPRIELRTVTWSEEGDYVGLQKCLKGSSRLTLVVSTHGCSASQLGHLFQLGMRPAPHSLIVFGPGAQEVVKERKVLEWVNGNAIGERVLNLTTMLMHSQEQREGAVMKTHFMSDCHDFKSVLMRILEKTERPLSERLHDMLTQLDSFIKEYFGTNDENDAAAFFRAFRDFLFAAVTKGPTQLEGEGLVMEQIMRYIQAMSSADEMVKHVNLGQESKRVDPPRAVQNNDEGTDNRILVSVLIVEDDENFARKLKAKYMPLQAQGNRFKVEFILHTPERENGKVIETRREFQERLIRRVRCQSSPREGEPLTRLQAVIMDYAMDDFAFDSNAGGITSLSGIDLSRYIRRLRPGVDLFLLTGKNIFKVVEESDGIFERVFWKWDPTHGELNELFYALNKCLDRKFHAPFWEALREFTRRPVIVMHAMSLARGKSAKKSAVLEDFVEFYHDNYFMAETSATIEPLDSLLHPVGSILQAQERSAHAFGAKKTLFVTNGTSTANKIVLQALLSPGDGILVDRNCHISHHYGISLAQARPYYLEPYHLDAYGISGGIPLQEISGKLNRFLDIENQGVSDQALMKLPKAILLTNCTFDGIICNPREVIKTVRTVLNERGINEARLRDIVFLFDEAWFAYARFHPRFVERTGMAAAQELCEEERQSNVASDYYNRNLRVYVTQSTHKTLSAFRQASMIHIWDPVLEASGIAALTLNEAFLTHTSTSPHSGIIASLDVARRQAELEGCALIEDALVISNAFRDDFRRTKEGGAALNWSLVGEYFDVLDADDLIPEKYRDEFLLDPSKITLHVKKHYSGSEMKKLLLAEDIQFNKHSDNTVLLMVNAGGSMSSMGTLKNVLTKMAKVINRQETLLGEVKKAPPALQIPKFSRFWDVEIKGHNPGQQRDIAFFFNNEAKWEIEWLPIGESLLERTSATFVVPYPPGYPVLVPGQVIDKPTVDFLTSIGTKEIHGARPGRDGLRELPVFVPPK
jgi:Arginine/lysine/ornithine decarboxylases